MSALLHKRRVHFQLGHCTWGETPVPFMNQHSKSNYTSQNSSSTFRPSMPSKKSWAKRCVFSDRVRTLRMPADGHSPITRSRSAPTTTSCSSAEKRSFPEVDLTSNIFPRAWNPLDPKTKHTQSGDDGGLILWRLNTPTTTLQRLPGTAWWISNSTVTFLRSSTKVFVKNLILLAWKAKNVLAQGWESQVLKSWIQAEHNSAESSTQGLELPIYALGEGLRF